MSLIIEKTYNLLDVLEKSDVIKKLTSSKEKLNKDDEVLSLIKKINKELPIYKHIKNITITTEPLIKTTTQKVKRFEELKKVEE